MRKTLVLVFALFLVVGLLWAGGGKETSDSEKEESKTEETKEESKKSDKYGGTLTRAYFAPNTLDPTFANSVTSGEICALWGDYLAYVDENMAIDWDRSLAKGAELSSDGLTYTFDLREGVMFHNGEEMTSKDVKVTFDRLRDKEVGAVTANLYANIVDITTPDDYTVVFKLKDKNPDFLVQLGEYQSIVTWHGTEDLATEQIGTGKFMVDTYLPEDRLTMKRNPNYWRTDSEGNQLPYLDGLDYLFLSESIAQVEALRAGKVNYLIYTPSEHIIKFQSDPDIDVHEKPGNNHPLVRMRSDRAPFNDVRVRQAFRAAVDREEILLGSYDGLGVTGRDTPIGPAYADFYLDVPEPKRDLEKAKRLLSEAGYGDGLEVTLTTQETSYISSLAIVLKEQLADAGVTVNIQLVPADVYYGGESLWLKADFAITDWGSRPSPQTYLDLAYTCDAKWNESHYCDPELDKLAAKSRVETDREKRAEIFKDIQRHFMEKGPLIVPYFQNNYFVASSKLKGIKPTSYYLTHVDLAVVYFED
jgi:peptide/nickel transport system substrate-binding protein